MPPILRVVWIDHHRSGKDWWTKEEIVKKAERPWTVITIGEVLYEDDACLVLVQEQQPDGTEDAGPVYRGWTAIMKKLIVEREELMPHKGKTGTGYKSTAKHPKPKGKGRKR